MDVSINSKSKPSHPTNIWNNNIDCEINYSHHAILVTNINNIEQYDM